MQIYFYHQARSIWAKFMTRNLVIRKGNFPRENSAKTPDLELFLSTYEARKTPSNWRSPTRRPPVLNSRNDETLTSQTTKPSSIIASLRPYIDLLIYYKAETHGFNDSPHKASSVVYEIIIWFQDTYFQAQNLAK